MSKSGKGIFFMGTKNSYTTLNKGRGASFDHVRKELLRKVIGMRLQGKSDQEIMEWLEDMK